MIPKILWVIGLGIIGFWVLGGQTKGKYRDVPMPILMGVGVLLKTKNIWVAIITCLCYNVIRLGYGNYEE